MCQNVRSAIDVIKAQSNRKTLSRQETIMLFEKVIEDSQKMGDRRIELEHRVGNIENKLTVVDGKIDNLNANIDRLLNKQSIFATKLADNKWFWISIIVLMLLIGSLLGANTDFVKAFNITGG